MTATLDGLLGLASLRRRYRAISGVEGREFLDLALRQLGVSWRTEPSELVRVPARGPVVVVANHPFGGVEGMLLARLLTDVRPDVKVLGNYLLSRIPELRELFIPVDPFGGPGAASRNVAGLRRAVEFLGAGGMLAVFPAGEVASLDLRRRTIDDPPWSETVARLARRAGASVVPVFFSGANGPFFQLAGLIHSRLRTALLPRQLLKRRARSLRVVVGRPLPAAALMGGTDAELIAALQGRTRLLALRGDIAAAPPVAARGGRHVAPPRPSDELATEIAALPPEALLAEGGSFRVFVASAGQIPSVLHEIGRCREITFRAAGEGTGRPLDLDRFDEEYLHLCLWDRNERQLAGAYRMVPTDGILRRGGLDGLYTSTLFRFGPEGVGRITPALELGRSFIRAEYQRSHSALLLLWQGIGGFIARNPRYRFLFGPVSISRDYRPVSRQLIVRYLTARVREADLLPSVRALRPFRLGSPHGIDLDAVLRPLQNLDDLSKLVAELEGDGRGVPVLLRHYLRLGGRVAQFNVDPDFSDVVDALVVVDLARTERALLARYLGREQAERFLAFHRGRARRSLGTRPETSGTNPTGPAPLPVPA